MKQLNWHIVFGNTHIIPDGRTVTPTDDIQTLLHCANIWDKDYTTLAEVLADDDTLFLICISNNAIDYLVRSTTWASSAVSVPAMTGDSVPSGVCSASGYYNENSRPYKAFDKSVSTNWTKSFQSGDYLQYKFTESKDIAIIDLYVNPSESLQASRLPKECILKGSADGVTYTDLISFTTDNTKEHNSFCFAQSGYQYYKLAITSNWGDSYVAVTEMQFYSASITASESAMQYIGASDYASETLLSDSTWLTAIDGSAYKDYVANVKNPNMTSNTTPEGEVIYSYAHSEYRPYYAFDGNLSTLCASPNNSPTLCYFGYKFTSARKVLYCSYYPRYNHATKTKVQASADNNTWVDMSEFQECPIKDSQTKYIIPLNNPSEYQSYRCQGTVTDGNGYGMNYWEINFYGRENAGVQTWLKAGGIKNKKYTTVSEVLSDLTTLAALMSSTDAIDYLVTAKGWATEICSDSNAMADIGMNNYAANTLIADETWLNAIANSAYVESVMNIKVPVMTDNTHPYGQCIYKSRESGFDAYKAFDGGSFDTYDLSSLYDGNDNESNGYIGYIFPAQYKIYICKAGITSNSNNARTETYKLQASSDAFVTPTDLTSVFNVPTQRPNVTVKTIVLNGGVTYSGFRLMRTSSVGRVSIQEMQFYGRKDI